MMFGPLDLVIHLKNLCWENDPPNKKIHLQNGLLALFYKIREYGNNLKVRWRGEAQNPDGISEPLKWCISLQSNMGNWL